MTHAIPAPYRQPMLGRMDRALRNSFIGASIFGVLCLVAVFVAPKRAPHVQTIEEMPERFARLILQEPKPPAPVVKPQQQVVMETPEPEPAPAPKADTPKPKPTPRPRRRTQTPKPDSDRGKAGRQKARTEVAQNLTQVTGSLDKVLKDLSTSLPASTDKAEGSGGNKRRRRAVRSGRGQNQLAAVGGVDALASAEVSGSALEGSGISIAQIEDVDLGSRDGVAGGTGSGGDGAGGGGEIRSNSSLLSVVRRYAAGIQFCYDNELKKNPGLRGKLVVSLTVLADGSVSEATVVEDTLRSSSVRSCVTAQINGWKFPSIDEGVVSFKTPFVFTPPQ